MRNPDVTIYCDGACSGNPGPGGWGAVLLRLGKNREVIIKELSGCMDDTTNNQMELTAAIEALRALRRPCRVKLYSDSQYVITGFTEWLPMWIKKGWRKKRGKIENADLWRDLLSAASDHEIEWNWVKGHDGDIYNERADKLAVQAAKRCR